VLSEAKKDRSAAELSARERFGLHRHTWVGLKLSKLSLFDYLVLAGGLVNLAVISGIIGFWIAGH
jgi:hypothetical protein